MLTYEQALAAILENSYPLPVVEKSLNEILGYALAQPLVAQFDLPQFDNSAVDGYGVRLSDLATACAEKPIDLRLVGEIAAGDAGEITLDANSAIKIFTGSVVPDSVDAVVMREYCSESNGTVSIGYCPERGENIRTRGAEFAKGKEVLSIGQRVNPPVVGLLANLGYPSFSVYEKPSVAIITTGNELVTPGSRLKAGQIFDSNSYALQAACTALGINKTITLHARDTKEETQAAFEEAIRHSDVVISAGGVSVGDHDHVKEVLEQRLKVKTIFWRIAIKPGKPVYFGILTSNDRTKLIFGLPGNPVSALVTYHQFVKPALLKLMGVQTTYWQRCHARLVSDLKKKPGRMDFVRAILSSADSGFEVNATRGQDSHMLTGLAKANSLLHFGAELEFLPAGSPIVTDILDWFE